MRKGPVKKSSKGEGMDRWRGGGGSSDVHSDVHSDDDGPLLVDVHDDDDVALRIAAGLGHTSVVRVLLDAGADIGACDGEPLALAAGNGHAETVKLLISRGADARAGHSRALRAAVLTGDAAVDCVRTLLDCGADARVMNDSCLLAACYKGDGEFPLPPLLVPQDEARVESAALLKYSYADVPSDGALYATPAIAAAAPMLPRAPRRYRNAAGRACATPVHTAYASESATPTAPAMPAVNMDALAVPSHRSAAPLPVTHIGVVRLLLARGVDANAQGGRPIVYASSKGWVRVAAVLLAYGADVHVRNDEPLREAAEHGHLHTVRLLAVAGADVHVDNDAPLRDAARVGHLDVVRELLARGVSARGPSGVLALRAAARGEWPLVVQELIAAGADSADAEFRASAMRSRAVRAALGIPHKPSFNRFMYQ
ncbi:hypothetical protein GGF43_003557 [Coemansia sp. RSA 2618]|nr:hypothetical protein GGF43_003557 [Coemansia sp. RSA 2618]